MLIENVKAEWIKITPETAEDGRYSLDIRPTAEQAVEIIETLQSAWEAERGQHKQPSWLGGYKEIKGENPRFTLKKKQYKEEDGAKILNTLKVFDRKKQLLDKVPTIANGAIINITAYPVLTEYKKKEGISLFIGAIQLIEWQEYSTDDALFKNLDEEENGPAKREKASTDEIPW